MDWHLEEGNGKATIEAHCSADGKGLYKAYAVGPTGRCLLGTMTPHQSGLALKKTLAVDALRQKGCWPVRRVETCLAYSFAGPSDAPAGWGALPTPRERERERERIFIYFLVLGGHNIFVGMQC